MLETSFTKLVGCAVPIQQAGMGQLANPRLAGAVAKAGGLGMVTLGGYPPQILATILDSVPQSSSGAIGANFLVPFIDRQLIAEQLAVITPRVRVVDFFWGEPDPGLVARVHAGGALASWQVGSREEAIAAAAAGCDFIIAQGIEAGGHVRGQIGVLALLDEVLAAVDIPVLAAGGIGTGRALAAVLAAGAAGARIGTRFVAAVEAEAHPDYVKALIAARPHDTIYTEAFSVGWPDAPHRVLRSAIAAAETFQGDTVGEFVDRYTGEREPIGRFQVLGAHSGVSGAVAAMPLWAGESVGGVQHVQPAAEIVRELTEAAAGLLRHWGGGLA